MPANRIPSNGDSQAANDVDSNGRAGATASKTTAPKPPSTKPPATKAGATGTTATKPPATKAGATGTTASRTPATKAAASKSPATKTIAPGSARSRPAAKSTSSRASAARSARTAAAGSSGSRPRPKSLVVKRRTPWGLILTCVLVVVFAAAVIGYAVSRPKKVSAADAPYVRNEIAAAKAINGVIFKKIIQHTHVTSPVKYTSSPPIGGNHSAVWADCSGTVYAKQIANENAVHPLEHGAVWITYRPRLDATSIATLSKLVTGVNYMIMTPYAGLKTPISLQAWNYQLFVNSASDPRIAAFIKALRNNPGTTPEYPGNCSNPAFKANPSTPGHAIWQ